ncbi:hypothetical protein M058_01040 [Streptococcus mitis 17/34]|nr:hypothetical protein M058_01040 [Streptococcus mitis 17/34]
MLKKLEKRWSDVKTNLQKNYTHGLKNTDYFSLQHILHDNELNLKILL